MADQIGLPMVASREGRILDGLIGGSWMDSWAEQGLIPVSAIGGFRGRPHQIPVAAVDS
jgi:hypothetical protein